MTNSTGFKISECSTGSTFVCSCLMDMWSAPPGTRSDDQPCAERFPVPRSPCEPCPTRLQPPNVLTQLGVLLLHRIRRRPAGLANAACVARLNLVTGGVGQDLGGGLGPGEGVAAVVRRDK